jgi:hypothetical protein
LLAEYTNAHDHAMESKSLDDHRAADALRMHLIEAYHRAYQRGGRWNSLARSRL